MRVLVVRIVAMFERVMHRLVRACSLGQITHALFEVGGQYRHNIQLLRRRKRDNKPRQSMGGTHGQFSAVRIDDGLCDGEAQAGAGAVAQA